MSTSTQPTMERLAGPFGPWNVRQLPGGKWVVEQLDRGTMRIRRYGPFTEESEARFLHADLTGEL